MGKLSKVALALIVFIFIAHPATAETNCKTALNHLLNAHKLPSYGKGSKAVHRTDWKMQSGYPVGHVEQRVMIIRSLKASLVKTEPRSYKLSYEAISNGTEPDDDDHPETIGKFKIDYNFKAVNGNCSLESASYNFSPMAKNPLKKEIEALPGKKVSEGFDKARCDSYLAGNDIGFHKIWSKIHSKSDMDHSLGFICKNAHKFYPVETGVTKSVEPAQTPGLKGIK